MHEVFQRALHSWYVMKYYCLSLMYSSVFLCFDNFVYCRLREAGLLTLGRLVEDGPIQLDRSLLTAVLAVTYRGLCDGCMKTHGNAILAGVPTTATTLVVREDSRWSAHRQPRALPRGHVRR